MFILSKPLLDIDRRKQLCTVDLLDLSERVPYESLDLMMLFENWTRVLRLRFLFLVCGTGKGYP